VVNHTALNFAVQIGFENALIEVNELIIILIFVNIWKIRLIDF